MYTILMEGGEDHQVEGDLHRDEPLESGERVNTGEAVEITDAEKEVFAITCWIEDKLKQARDYKLSTLGQPDSRDVVQFLQEIWPDNDQRAGSTFNYATRFKIPADLGQLTVRFDATTSEYDRTFRNMMLRIGDVRSATTQEEMEQAFLRTLEALYHEVEHLNKFGADEPHDKQETVDYLGNPGELSAFGRQFAFRYMLEYPGEDFDLDKMIALTRKLTDGKVYSQYYNYFISCADPLKQEEYREFGDLHAIHEAIIAETIRHMHILRTLIAQKNQASLS